MYTCKELEAQGVPPERLEIRRLRLAKRVSAAELARLANVAPQTVQEFEIGAAWTAAYRHRFLKALAGVQSRDYAAEMRAWRKANSLTVVQAATLLGINERSWRTAESRGFKYGPKRLNVSALEALLRTGLQPPVANKPEAGA